MRRLEAIDAAKRGRANDRTVRLAAERKRDHAGSYCGCRSARRPARCVRGVVRVACLSGMKVRTFGRDRLAQNDSASSAQSRNHRSVNARRASAMQRRAVFGRHVRGVDDVLDADRYAAEGSGRLTRAAQVIRGARLRKREILVEEGPGLNLRLCRANALEASADELFAAEASLLDQPHGLRGA